MPAVGFIEVAVIVLIFVVVGDAVLENGLLGDDVEVTVGDWIVSLLDEFCNIFWFIRVSSKSCSLFHSSSRSRSRFFSLNESLKSIFNDYLSRNYIDKS